MEQTITDLIKLILGLLGGGETVVAGAVVIALVLFWFKFLKRNADET